MLPNRILEDLARAREQDVRRGVQRCHPVPQSHQNRLWMRTAGLIRRGSTRFGAAPRAAVAKTACCT